MSRGDATRLGIAREGELGKNPRDRCIDVDAVERRELQQQSRCVYLRGRTDLHQRARAHGLIEVAIRDASGSDREFSAVHHGNAGARDTKLFA